MTDTTQATTLKTPYIRELTTPFRSADPREGGDQPGFQPEELIPQEGRRIIRSGDGEPEDAGAKGQP